MAHAQAQQLEGGGLVRKGGGEGDPQNGGVGGGGHEDVEEGGVLFDGREGREGRGGRERVRTGLGRDAKRHR
jgi:hypothetical protein